MGLLLLRNPLAYRTIRDDLEKVSARFGSCVRLTVSPAVEMFEFPLGSAVQKLLEAVPGAQSGASQRQRRARLQEKNCSVDVAFSMVHHACY